MDHYTKLMTQVSATYDIQVDPRILGPQKEAMHGVTLDIPDHRLFARSILAGEEVSAAHPYYQGYFQSFQKLGWVETWEAALSRRTEAILDIRERGVLEPVELFFDNDGIAYYHGYHRLAAALELGLQSIPARLHLITDHLSQLAQVVFSQYTGEFKYSLYQPIEHPFFSLFPQQIANACWDQKVAILTEATRGWSGRIVEVGAHFGMMTRALQQAGLHVEATDLDAHYLNVQPLLEGVGQTPIRYTRISLQEFARTTEEPVRLIMMGLMHHLMGKADLWEAMQGTVLPWMQQWVPEMVVEMSLLSTYLGEAGVQMVTSDQEVEAFWQRYGYTSERLMEGAMQRVTYHIRKS